VRGVQLASVRFEVIHNADGYRDRAHGKKVKPRLAFLGDSYVWGYDVQQKERFSDLLQEQNPQREILNFGVSGYGTDQEFLLLQKLSVYQADLVFLIFCNNDPYDTSNNYVYEGYYKPYYVKEGEEWKLHGVPVPKSVRYYLQEVPFLSHSHFVSFLLHSFLQWKDPSIQIPPSAAAMLLQMHTYVKNQGANFAVGLVDRNPEIESILTREKIPFVDLSEAEKYPSFGNHWTPAGHRVVQKKIQKFLKNF
jgi:hypothetical protein